MCGFGWGGSLCRRRYRSSTCRAWRRLLSSPHVRGHLLGRIHDRRHRRDKVFRYRIEWPRSSRRRRRGRCRNILRCRLPPAGVLLPLAGHDAFLGHAHVTSLVRNILSMRMRMRTTGAAVGVPRIGRSGSRTRTEAHHLLCGGDMRVLSVPTTGVARLAFMRVLAMGHSMLGPRRRMDWSSYTCRGGLAGLLDACWPPVAMWG